MTLRRIVGVLAAILAGSPLHAQAQPEPGHWTYALTPYVWLPNVNGTLNYGTPPGASGSPDVGVGPNNYLENLQGVLMLAGEARNGRWSIVADLIYLDFGSEKSHVRSVNFGGSAVDTNLNADTKSSLKGFQLMLAGGYNVVQTPRATLDVLGGLRYLGIEAKTDWQLAANVSGPGAGQTFPAAGSVSSRSDLVDAIVGIRGRVRLGESPWFVPYLLDAGAGSSSRTWEGLLGIAYGFKWGDTVLAYRHLYYDESGDGLFQSFSFSGPSLGATFRF
jgi:hypothetical protein